MVRRIVTLVLLLGLLGAGILFLFPEWTGTASDPPYRLASVERGAIVAAVSATGTINPTTTVIVGSQLSGQVVEILADYNSEVKAGQVVARLNSDQIRARLDASRADLEQVRATLRVQEAQVDRVLADIERAKATRADAEAQVRRNEALLADTERGLKRQQDLRSRGVTTEAAFDTARTQRDAQRASLESARAMVASAGAQEAGLAADLAVARAQVQAVSAQVRQREATVRQIEVDLRNTDIRSPVNGTVVQRNVELGATVAASLQAPTLFLIADDLRRMEVAANIDETDVGRIRPGQRVTFTVNAYPNRTFEGTVRQVRLGSQTVQNVVIYTTIIVVENPRQELLPGMTANLRIETDRREDVLRVANAALRWRPPASAPAESAPGPAMAADGGSSPGSSSGASGGGRGRGGAGGAQALAAFADAIRAELAPTPEQQKEIDAAFADMRRSFAERRGSGEGPQARREAAQAARTALVQRIEAVLTPEQRGRFAALRTRLAAAGGRGAPMQSGRVYILGADGSPEAVPVRLGVTDGSMTEIAGERIVAGIAVIVGGGPRPAAPAAAPQRRGPRFGF